MQWPQPRTTSSLSGGEGPVRLLRASWGRESTAILIPAQIAIFLLIAATMVKWFAQMHRRNGRSWEAILARMSPECRLAIAAGHSELLNHIWMKTPAAAFRDAGVLMEMADYVERHALSADRAKMQTLRSAAVQLRIAAAGAMIKRASLHSSRNV